jgi:outer membrane protein TolC
MRERLAGYGAVLLTAMREVEDALVNETKQNETISLQKSQYEAAVKTLYYARLRYRRGLTDYLPVMNAINREQALAQTMVETRRELLSYRIQLCRALGRSVDLEQRKINEVEKNNE